MKTMTISYRMYRNNKTKTTADSITLQMTPEHAGRIMAGEAVEHLDILLDRLAMLQGYDTAGALTVCSHDGDGHCDPLAGAEDWNAGDEDWVPGEDNDN